MPARRTLEFCQKAAEIRGGKCLSTEYKNNTTPMLWECDKKHQWKTALSTIINGKCWCKYCNPNSLKTLKFCQELAAQRGGKCLSDEYISCKIYMLWECKERHQWEAPLDPILNQQCWCPSCNKHDLEFCKKIANNKGGKCLSTEYKNNKTQMCWECNKGHVWNTSLNSIYTGNTWCPKCSPRSAKTQEKFILEALICHQNEYNYSKFIYINTRTPGIIICNKCNREFEQTPHTHLNNHGCPFCLHLISTGETAWLNYLQIPKEYHHKSIICNKRKIQVDAYDPIKNIIYEFNGDFWHGNPSKFNPDDINPIANITYKKLYAKTLLKKEVLETSGYTVISIWESNFIAILKKEGKTIKDYLY